MWSLAFHHLNNVSCYHGSVTEHIRKIPKSGWGQEFCLENPALEVWKKKISAPFLTRTRLLFGPPPPRTIEPLGKGVVRKKFQSCLSLVLEIYYFFPPLLFKRTPYHSDVLLSDHLILFQLYLRYWKEELTPGIMLIPPPSPALLTLHTVRGNRPDSLLSSSYSPVAAASVGEAAFTLFDKLMLRLILFQSIPGHASTKDTCRHVLWREVSPSSLQMQVRCGDRTDKRSAAGEVTAWAGKQSCWRSLSFCRVTCHPSPADRSWAFLPVLQQKEQQGRWKAPISDILESLFSWQDLVFWAYLSSTVMGSGVFPSSLGTLDPSQSYASRCHFSPTNVRK